MDLDDMYNEEEEGFGDVISSYSREDAIADGELIDARAGDLAEVTAQHLGNKPDAHVVITRGLFHLIETAVKNPRYCNDIKGIWHDILFMGRATTVQTIKNFVDGRYGPVPFRVIITGVGRTKYQTVHVGFDGDALTYGLAEDF